MVGFDGGAEFEFQEPKSCFPVTQKAIDVVGRKIIGGNIGAFTDATLQHHFGNEDLAVDLPIAEVVNRAFGWYQEEIPHADRKAFLDGFAYVYSILNEQGTLPHLPESRDAVQDNLRKTYEVDAQQQNMSLGERLSFIDEANFGLIGRDKLLGGSILANALFERKMLHPSPDSFAAGAEMTYLMLKEAYLQNTRTDWNGELKKIT